MLPSVVSARTPHLRPLNPASAEEVELVAQRMRQTLVEVLGEEAGIALYSMDWLRARLLWHLDQDQCTGEVFVIQEDEGPVLGHAIVRLEKDSEGVAIGLISTIFVTPESRRRGLATQLLLHAEA